MKAMILAAGRGSRMNALTQDTPKPLLKLGSHALIEHKIFALKKAGFTDIVINIRYHAERIRDYLKDGSQYGVAISYSLETTDPGVGGGIKKAISLLGNQPFLLTSSDVVTDYPFDKLRNHHPKAAHLVLVDNPEHHQQGDFALNDQGIVTHHASNTYCYAGFGVFHPTIFLDIPDTSFPFITPLLKPVSQGLVTGEYYNGLWVNADTPERLAKASESLINN